MGFPPQACWHVVVCCVQKQVIQTGRNTEDGFTHAATVLGQVKWSLLLFSVFVAFSHHFTAQVDLAGCWLD